MISWIIKHLIIARGSEPLIYPYIRPFGPRFQPEEEIPYLKYRKALEECGKDLSEPLLGVHHQQQSKGPLPGLQSRRIEVATSLDLEKAFDLIID